MDHVVAAVENALTSGRWNDAAPLLNDILVYGVQCTLRPLAEYEKLAGRECDNTRVRHYLTFRLRMVSDAQKRFKADSVRFEAERLAKVVREHGFPCRVIGNGHSLRVAEPYQKPNGMWGWTVFQIDAESRTVAAWLGYSSPREGKVA